MAGNCWEESGISQRSPRILPVYNTAELTKNLALFIREVYSYTTGGEYCSKGKNSSKRLSRLFCPKNSNCSQTFEPETFVVP